MKEHYTFDFENKTVIVTGGASGLGKAIAEGFSYKRANVVLCDINKETGINICKRLKEKDYSAEFEYVDVTDEQSVKDLVNRILGKYGKIDIIVNSAGINIRKPVIETTLDDLRKVLDVNFIGTFLMSREVLKTMINKSVKGKIINLASIFGVVAFKGQCSYAASKGAIVQFTRVSAIEAAEYGICVNAIAPSYIDTPLVRPLMDNKEVYNELKNKIEGLAIQILKD